MLLNEMFTQDKPVKVVYGGRFQPPHLGHYGVYKWLVKYFGINNTFVATSAKTDAVKSPLDFTTKRTIWTDLLNVPASQVIQCVNPTFTPKEVFVDSPGAVYVTVTGEKDKSRYVSSGYYKPYPMNENEPASFDKVKDDLQTYEDHGYYIIAPTMANGLSGTVVRDSFKNGNTHQKKKIFTKLYGDFDEEIFQLLVSKLS